MFVSFTRSSNNRKTGPIPVTMTEKASCPPSCRFQGSGCYAEVGWPLNRLWASLTEGGPTGRGTARRHSWADLCHKVASLPKGQLWRHNQAGDLPGKGAAIDHIALAALVDANRGRRGFTYTHKPMSLVNRQAVFAANRSGFTINLSADTLAEADRLAGLGAGPVVVVVAQDAPKHGKTPGGRPYVVCPAQQTPAERRGGRELSCATCGLCAQADRKGIVAFRVHGSASKRALKVIQSISGNT